MFILYPNGGPFNVSYIRMAIIKITACIHAIKKHAIVQYLFNLHFYPFLSTRFVGRKCNTCSYAIKSYDQKCCIALCILINVIEKLELKTHKHKQHPSLYKEAVQ